MNEIIDILGNKLKCGDICAYIKAERTGSSTVRKILHTGKIIDITKAGNVVFEGGITVYVPNDIVKLETPVVHGRWVNNGIPDSVLSGCSVCGCPYGSSGFNYCPHCGAKMDGDAE